MNRVFGSRVSLLFSVLLLPICVGHAALFPGNARLEVTDSTGGLSWNSSANAMIVQCWFKISIPSGTNLTENMTILVNRLTGSQADAHAYLIQFNINTGNIEFSARGTGLYTNTLIARPYLERWYHVAVVRQGEVFTGYTDGRLMFSSGGTVGNSTVTQGVSIGGWGSSQYLYGEVQEVSVYQSVPTDAQAFIVQNMFSSQPTNDPSLNLKGYFPLAFSTNTADQFRNFAPAPVPSGTASATASGPVTFEEANQAGEQSAFDTRKNGGRDALSPLSGGFSWQQTAQARPTPGITFDFRFGYSSANVSGTYSLVNFDPYATGPLGKGWRHTFETRVLPAQAFSPLGDTDTIGLMSWDGTLVTWDKDLNSGLYFTRDREYHGEFTLTSTNCQWTTPERLVYIFRKPDSGAAIMRGRLTAIRDFNSNAVQILWNEISGVVTQAVDSAGGKYVFNYQAGLVTNVTFGQWLANFTYDSTNRLISKSITNTSGLYTNINTTWQFLYSTNGLLDRIVDPRVNTNVLVQYDKYGRITNQVDALNRATTTEYGVPGKRQIRRTDSGTNQWVETYDRKGHILSQQDPLTNITTYTYDTNGNRISITEPLGWMTTFGYDDRANVIASTNALGEVNRWVFHPFFNKAAQDINPLGWTNFYELNNTNGNLLRHYDALGALVTYTYFTNGLVMTATDANAHVSSMSYDTNGFLKSKTDAALSTWTYTLNDVGWKLAEMNPLGDLTFLTLDLNGNVVRTVDPLNRIFTRTFDANGNLLAASDGKGQNTRHFYDAANQRNQTIDRSGNTNLFFYSTRGKLERITDPIGNTSTNYYDSANRLERVSNGLGFTTTNVFDANGNVIALMDQVAQRWTKTYDRLNRAIADSNPQGDTRTTSYDAAGRIKQITTPNGYPSLHFYDGRGRLTKWVDAENFQWLYDYDGVANITNITDALGGHYVMTYGLRNERKTEINQDTNQWSYDYDELLRLRQQIDPNGTTRTLIYDPVSRVQSVTFNTGRQNTFSYDDNNNPRTITRRVGLTPTTTRFTYDSLDRAIDVTDAFSQTIHYGYDALGRVVALTYPAGKVLVNRFDAIGRVTNQVDWAGRQMTYSYDKADRLLARTYPNGITQTNSFDTAGRITSLSYAPSLISSNSINIALTYAYDRNGNKTGGGERGTFAWPLPSLIDETSRFTPAGRITNRVDVLNSTNNFTYQYDASGNMTNASGGGQSWALTYDEDNRTTSIFWRLMPMTDKLITNRYDALGRRISRTLDAVETRYVLDLQGSMERTLCDTDASGNITAWYVHGPDLSYKVNATNGLTCYHADAQANISALTDGSANLVAQYAYTPYGRSLGSTNFQSQFSNSYLFVGSQGVMEELPGLYFMRARYYSADAGVFLSSDPVKNIGPGWKPEAFSYAQENPLKYTDPNGQNPWVAAFALGWFKGSLEGLAESAAVDLTVASGMGNERREQIAELGFQFKSFAHTIHAGGQLIESGASVGGVGVAFYIGDQVANHTTDPILKFSKFLMNSYMNGINAAGNVGGNILNSLGYGVQKASSSQAPSMPSRTATVAAPKASGTTAATSTKPSGGSGGGTTSTSSGGGGSTTYTVKSGDTLGNIGYNYGSSAAAIGAANGLQNLNVIRPGQVLTIPRRR